MQTNHGFQCTKFKYGKYNSHNMPRHISSKRKEAKRSKITISDEICRGTNWLLHALNKCSFNFPGECRIDCDLYR